MLVGFAFNTKPVVGHEKELVHVRSQQTGCVQALLAQIIDDELAFNAKPAPQLYPLPELQYVGASQQRASLQTPLVHWMALLFALFV
jgi:hypothetical protein